MSQQKKMWIAVLVVFAILLVIAVKTNKPSSSTQTETTTAAQTPTAPHAIEQVDKGSTESEQTSQEHPGTLNDQLTTAATEEAKPAPLPRFVELGADKCIPCKMMQPILADLRKEYAGKLQVDFIDVWEHPEQANKYGIRSIPTQVIYDSSGEEVFRHIGFYPKEEIVSKLAELGVK